MLEDGIRQRIERLRLNLLEQARDFRPEIARPKPVPLEEIDGLRDAAGSTGRCAVIERDIDDYVQAGPVRSAARVLLGASEPEAGPPRLLFLDLETTGFSSTPLFLAGTVFEHEGLMRSLQYLARDYSEEKALLSLLDEQMRNFDVCVTFNGKSFDIPYIRDRAAYHGISLQASPEQYDLLHVARRHWKNRLPDCRLVTLETHILGRSRIGDVPGREVPCIYHDFVHTKDARQLKGVLRHNMVDCISMAQLFISLAEAATC